jgi:hypothetical protein
MDPARNPAATSGMPPPAVSFRRLLGGMVVVCLISTGARGEGRSLTATGLFGASNGVWPVSEVESSAEGEAEPEFETDRDSFTPSTVTVERSRVMIESAWTYIDNRDVADTNSLPELVLRYGLTDRLELRLGTNFEAGGESNVASTGAGGFSLEVEPGIERETQVSYGFKAMLTDQDGWIPESSLLVMGNTPVSGPSHSTQGVFTYVWGWNFENGWKWDSAVRYGVTSEDGERHNQFAPSTVLKVPVGEQWDLHAEYFGIFSEGAGEERQAHYLSPGAAWKIAPNVELGVRVGWGLNDDASKFFSNAGVAWQF